MAPHHAVAGGQGNGGDYNVKIWKIIIEIKYCVKIWKNSMEIFYENMWQWTRRGKGPRTRWETGNGDGGDYAQNIGWNREKFCRIIA